jgi:penicillin-binding protein 1A
MFKTLMPKAKKNPRKKRSWVWRLIRWAFFLSLCFAALVAVIISWYAKGLPEIKGFDMANKKPSIIFLTRDHREIVTQGHIYGETVTADKVPKNLINALIATEDRRFFEHSGIDVQGLFRAFFKNLISGHVVQGGSTLTQQLVKNILLTHERSFTRKIQEIILAVWLERHFTKKQILSIYMNRVYLGGGTFGVDAAAQLYFGKPIVQLSLPECAIIAGLLKAPNRYAQKHDQLKARGIVVLHNMLENGNIKPKQYKEGKKVIEHMVLNNKRLPSYRYFTDWISTELESLVDTSQDLIVTTTLDAKLQTIATDAITQTIRQHGKPLNIEQAAFLAMSYDGAVRALVGGTHYFTMQYNLATQARRQSGSAFKPIVYLTALEQGYPLDYILDDSPYHKGKWTANNFGWESRGSVTLQEGLTYSINTATIRLAEKVGIDPIIEMTKRLGFSSKPPRNLSIALGTAETSLIELVSAYTMIANQGIRIQPYGILEIRTADGKLLYQRPSFVIDEFMNPELMNTLIHLLENVVQEGTGKLGQIPGKIVAGKTGTTQNFRDAWFIGFTEFMTAGVWMGNPHESPMKRVAGGTIPAVLWKTIMARYLA